MKFDRRQIFKGLFGIGAASALPAEENTVQGDTPLTVPRPLNFPEQRPSVPEPSFITPQIIARETMRLVLNRVSIGFAKGPDVKVGDYWNSWNYGDVHLKHRFSQMWLFQLKDLRLSLDEYSARYCEPAAYNIANQIALDGLKFGNPTHVITSPVNLPEHVVWGCTDEYAGLALRVWKDYNSGSDQEAVRIDLIYGFSRV